MRAKKDFGKARYISKEVEKHRLEKNLFEEIKKILE